MVLARTTLWYIAFCGFAVNYMIRLNINIAIVGMVRPKRQSIEVTNFAQVGNATDTQQDNVTHSGLETTHFLTGPLKGSLNVTEVDLATNLNDLKRLDNLFEWDEIQQGHVLGAFFWLHWVSQVPGGMLARKYGTKKVFGLANLCISLMAYLIPFCAKWSFGALVAIRSLQGIVSGFSWPAMHHMTAIWIPQHERSKFVSAYLGSSFGAALTYPLCGFIMDKLSWEWVFHITATIGVVWYAFWCWLVYDTPAQHPTISAKEREYILMSNGGMTHQRKMLPPVPWREILTSTAVNMNVIGQFGGIWGLFTLMTQAPTYLKVIHGINIKMNGIYSGLPHLCRWGFSYGFAIFCDKLLRSGRFSKTLVRKIATTFSTIIQGLLVWGLAYSGHNTPLAIFFLVTATMVNGAVSSGPLASLVDLSPNFAGVLQGISGMISVFPGFISPVAVAYLTLGSQTVEQWQKVFVLSTAIMVISGVIYDVFATSELQPWNDGSKSTDDKAEKMKIVQPIVKSQIVRILPINEKPTDHDKEEDF
nr:PREDICTED: sialin-like [Bemisia tabaci]